MKILLSGSSGLVGSALRSSKQAEKYEIFRLLRSKPNKPSTNSVVWNAKKGDSQIPEVDGIVHLAGESIVGRWTKNKKQKIFSSRKEYTENLVQAVLNNQKLPRVFVCASAIGIYGDRGDEELNETSSFGTGFLSETTQAWEAACAPLEKAGVRVVNLRIGVVLSKNGGALAKMLPAFKFGLGGNLGDGKQWMSWISVEDLVEVIHLSLNNADISGPVNVTSPNPVTNKTFTKTLGAVIKRPTLIPIPKFVLEIIFGEMAKETLLLSSKVHPQKLLSHGFEFKHPELKQALDSQL